MKNMRRHFFIDKSFQSRYGLYVAITLFVVCGVAVIGLYYGIWSSVVESFSEGQIYNEIKTAARIQDYEHSREPVPDTKLSSLRLFKEVDLLSARQREILEDILVRTNQKLIAQAFLLIIFIGFGSIYLTHKIAGPLYRFRKSFEAVKDGDLKMRIYLRKHDEGMLVASAFNDMMKHLAASIARLKSITQNSNPAELKAKTEAELAKFKTTDWN